MAKQRVEKTTPTSESEADSSLPELWGYGIEKLPGGKYIAFLVSNRGGLKVLTPMRAGKHQGEMKHSAVARVSNAFRIFIAAPEMARRKGLAA
jgi:hypothetical protein